MLECDLIEHVLIWSNAFWGHKSKGYTPTEKIKKAIAGLDASIVGGHENIYTLGRYQAAWIAQTDLIATCDDDTLVKNWDTLFRKQAQLGGLVANLDRGHFRMAKNKYEHKYRGGTAYETLVGWGAVFPRAWIENLKLYETVYGKDEIYLRKADRIFALLANRPHHNIEVNVHHLQGATEKHALYHMRDHWSMNREAYRRCLAILESTAVASQM